MTAIIYKAPKPREKVDFELLWSRIADKAEEQAILRRLEASRLTTRRVVMDNLRSWITSTDLAHAIDISNNVAVIHLHKLLKLGLAERRKTKQWRGFKYGCRYEYRLREKAE